MRSAQTVGLLAVVAWDARGCRTPPAEVELTCASVRKGTAPFLIEELAGDFSLTLINSDGRSVEGRLKLVSYAAGSGPAGLRDENSARGTAFPAFGSTRIRLSDVGAASPGSTESEDPDAPGVLAIQWTGAGQDARENLLLRFGKDVNTGGLPYVDGTSMALSVLATWPDSFAGTWRSGDGIRGTEGHFCARRVDR